MTVFSSEELEIINIHIGLNIRIQRLKKGLSQFDLGDLIRSNNTAIGRIERAEHFSSWSNILLICQVLDIKFESIFILVTKVQLYELIDICYSLDSKLTAEKEKYYKNLKNKIDQHYK